MNIHHIIQNIKSDHIESKTKSEQAAFLREEITLDQLLTAKSKARNSLPKIIGVRVTFTKHNNVVEVGDYKPGTAGADPSCRAAAMNWHIGGYQPIFA